MDDLVVGDLVVPASELEERFDTPGGPGGQHANRTASAVTLRFNLSESSLPPDIRQRLIAQLGEVVEVRAADSRSQAMNREIARERLTGRIRGALVEPKRRKRTRPTKAARERRLSGKRARSDLKRSRRKPEKE